MGLTNKRPCHGDVISLTLAENLVYCGDGPYSANGDDGDLNTFLYILGKVHQVSFFFLFMNFPLEAMTIFRGNRAASADLDGGNSIISQASSNFQ